jgi:flagellar hook-basal body complex protein FliE
MPIDPTMLTKGVDWSVGGLDKTAGAEGSVEGLDGAAAGSGGSFGQMLANQLGGLENLQVKSSEAARSLADGTATDPSTAVVAVERARLAMQLASQLRTKGLEAINDVMHTQV